MARLTTIQHFKSVSHLKETTGVLLPKPYEWRLLVDPVIGHIHGLPTTQGVAIATNGIEVVILQSNGVVLGHLDFFEPDEQENQIKIPVKHETKTPRIVRDISEFV